MDRFDLNLFAVFEAVLRERSVSRAAVRLHLSQPAVSHALNRLRHATGDHLFVRTPHGMEPTPLAQRLAGPVQRALLDLRGALAGDVFRPAEARNRFVIVANNAAAITLVGPLIHEVAGQAPAVNLTIRPSGTLDVVDLLDRGEIDLALVGHAPPLSRFRAVALVEDDYVAVMRRGHPLQTGRFDRAALGACAHLAISSSGDDLSWVDEALAAEGMARQIAAEVPYLSAGSVVTRSDLIAIMGRKVGETFRQAFPVELVDLPVPTPRQVTWLVWPARLEDHPAHVWLRAIVVAVAAGETPAEWPG